jgi:hypothetical protein
MSQNIRHSSASFVGKDAESSQFFQHHGFLRRVLCEPTAQFAIPEFGGRGGLKHRAPNPDLTQGFPQCLNMPLR